MKYIDYDWSEMIFDMIRAGKTRFEIAREVGSVSEPTIRTYMAGACPTHWRGELILGAWERITGKTRQDAPMIPAPMRANAVGRRRAGV